MGNLTKHAQKELELAGLFDLVEVVPQTNEPALPA